MFLLIAGSAFIVARTRTHVRTYTLTVHLTFCRTHYERNCYDVHPHASIYIQYIHTHIMYTCSHTHTHTHQSHRFLPSSSPDDRICSPPFMVLRSECGGEILAQLQQHDITFPCSKFLVSLLTPHSCTHPL